MRPLRRRLPKGKALEEERRKASAAYRRLAGLKARKERQKFLLSPDDWYPSYAAPIEHDRDAVRATLQQVDEGEAFVRVALTVLLPPACERLPLPPAIWRVSAWGIDCAGLVKEFRSYRAAKSEYDGLSGPLLMDDLFGRGYQLAGF